LWQAYVMAGIEGERSQSKDTELQALAEQLRTRLRVERERQGEGFNEAEFVRERLTSELSHAAGERQQYFQSLLTSFDAVAYGRYTSDTVKEDALDRIAESEATDGRYIHLTIGVTPQVAASLGVLTSALDIPHRPWSEYRRYDPPPYFVGKGVSVSSKTINGLIEKSGGRLQRIPRLRPRAVR
jgi:hypothetical protein